MERNLQTRVCVCVCVHITVRGTRNFQISGDTHSQPISSPRSIKPGIPCCCSVQNSVPHNPRLPAVPRRVLQISSKSSWASSHQLCQRPEDSRYRCERAGSLQGRGRSTDQKMQGVSSRWHRCRGDLQLDMAKALVSM